MAISHNKKYEREFVNMMNSQGTFCMRIAGSGSGREAVCDCVYFKDGITYLVEVKATKEKKLIMRKVIREQLERLKKVAEENKCVPVLAVRYKGRGWENRTL